MTESQTEMFPAEEADRAQAVLNYLTTQRDKAEKSVATAEEKLEALFRLIDRQEHVLKLLRDYSVTQTEPAEVVEDAEVVGEEPQQPAIDGVAENGGVAYETATGEVVERNDEDEPWEYEGPEGQREEAEEETAA